MSAQVLQALQVSVLTVITGDIIVPLFYNKYGDIAGSIIKQI